MVKVRQTTKPASDFTENAAARPRLRLGNSRNLLGQAAPEHAERELNHSRVCVLGCGGSNCGVVVRRVARSFGRREVPGLCSL